MSSSTITYKDFALCEECRKQGNCRMTEFKKFLVVNDSFHHHETDYSSTKLNEHQKKVKSLLNHLPLNLEDLFTSFNLGADEENLQKGITAFQNEVYQEALHYLEPLLTYHELKCKLALFVASAQFHIGEYNAAGFMFQLINFSYNSKLEKEVDEVIEICEHLTKEKAKAEIAIEQLLYQCMSEDKNKVLQL